MNPHPSLFAQSIANLYHANAVIASNLAYLLQELPALALPNHLQSEISTLCQEFEWTLYDVKTEIRNLEDKLGLHPDEEPFDPDIVNPDPKVTMEFIEDWLGNRIQSLDELTRKLSRLATQDEQTYGPVNVLVTESAKNILEAHAGTQAELKAIWAAWEQQQGG